jgi:hypothetical protein
MQWVTGALSLGVKRQGREVDHSPPSSAEVKKGGAVPHSPYVIMALRLSNKAQGQLYLLLSSTNILTIPHFRRINQRSLCYDFSLHSSEHTPTCVFMASCLIN